MTSDSGSRASRCRRLISSRARPEQNAVPAPRITTTRTRASRSSSLKRRCSPSSMAVLSAFRRSGRLSVMVAMPSASAHRISSAMSISSGSAEQRARNHHAVDCGRALADAAHARLTVPALERKLLGDAVAAVNLDRGVHDAPEHLARVELGDRRLDARVLTAISLPRAVPDEPAARADLDLGIREHPLDGLALAQRCAEGRALLGMGDGHAMRGDGHTQIARRVWKAVFHEEIEGQVEALALRADQALGGKLAVLEDHVVRHRGRTDGPDGPRAEPWRPALEDEARDAAAPLRPVGPRPHDAPRRVVGARDEDLPTVQHPAIATLLGARLDRAGRVGSPRGLRDGKERLQAIADGRHRVLGDLLLAPRPDRGGRVAPEDAAARIVETHPVLRLFFERDAHGARVEAG